MNLSDILGALKSAIPLVQSTVSMVDELAPSLDIEGKISKVEAAIAPVLSVVPDALAAWSALKPALVAHAASTAAAADPAA